MTRVPNQRATRASEGATRAIYVIDPDSGWRYGFPKLFDAEPNQSIDDWLVKNGYPQDLVDMWKNSRFKSVPCRFWRVGSQ